MAKRYGRIWGTVAALGAAAGLVVAVPGSVDEAPWRVDRLQDAHEGSPAQVLKEAAERALAAGAADVEVTGSHFLYGRVRPESGRMSWKSPHEAVGLPTLSRWRVDNDVYRDPATDPAYDGNPEVEDQYGVAAHVSGPEVLSTLLVAGNAKRLGPEPVRGRPAMGYRWVVADDDIDALLSKTFPCQAPATPAQDAWNDPFHVTAWLDEGGQVVRVQVVRPGTSYDTVVDFHSFGGPAVTLPPGAEPMPGTGSPRRKGCSVR
ncbi:hypothetical protein [Streptomyces sp. NPDC086023]|uniref:hypothetical protein n=1 Tax=Streptomyces sp. NPDC086023 TaxID=3365746 RepID=UPI0037D422B7